MAALYGISIEKYLELFHAEKDRERRSRMKRLAHSAMYGSNPSATVFLPADLLLPKIDSNKGGQDVRSDGVQSKGR